MALRAVSVTALGTVDPRPVVAALESIHVTVAPSGDADMDVLLVADYLEPDLDAINSAALDTGRPWLLASTEFEEVWVGPLFAPDHGPCWECLAQRLRLRGRVDGPAPGALASTRAAAARVVATEVARALTGSPQHSEQILTLDTHTSASVRHRVIRRPQCPACGVPDASLDAPAHPPALAPSGATPSETGLRSVAPEVTWSRWSHHVSPVSGVARVLRPVTGAPPWQHIYEGAVAGGATSVGKGTTAEEARTSALCEALERYCGQLFGEEPRRRGSLRSLGDPAIHPNECMHFSERQYADREQLNLRAASPRSRVPQPFDPDEEMDWSPLWSLSEQRERLLPAAYCYYDAPRRDPDFRANSNGCAAGNTIDEAILHGLLELVERDHAAVWWYNRLPAAGIDLDTVGSEWLANVRRCLLAAGRVVWALDLTADLGIPVVTALSHSATDGADVAIGFGAALDGPTAVVRAVTEMLQSQWAQSTFGVTSVPAAGDDEWSHLRPDPRHPGMAASALPELASADRHSSLAACLDRLRAAGIEVLVLDQTRPDVGLPVVRVVAPRLRHFWPRFAPGRLYDVPVATGRLERPRSEDELVATAPGP